MSSGPNMSVKTVRHTSWTDDIALQAAMVLLLAGAGWLIYRRLPEGAARVESSERTTLQIFIKQTPESVGPSLDVAVSLYPVDIIAVRHESFTETRQASDSKTF